MNLEYMGELIGSFALFAPGLMLFTLLCFVGVLMAVEKLGLLGPSFKNSKVSLGEDVDFATNPAPGRIVAQLDHAVSARTADEADTGAANLTKVKSA